MKHFVGLMGPVLGLALLAGCGDDSSEPGAADPTTSASSSTDTDAATVTATVTATDEDPVSISLYDADFTVDASGALAAVEMLTIDVPVDDRHGIFRTFDGVEVDGFTATLDGAETPVTESVDAGLVTYKIGDPDQTLSVGEHVVRMEYGVRDVLVPGDGAEPWFDQLLIPSEWDLRIGSAELTVELPEPSGVVECTVGADPCDVSGEGTSTLTITTGSLDVHTAVRVAVYRSLEG